LENLNVAGLIQRQVLKIWPGWLSWKSYCGKNNKRHLGYLIFCLMGLFAMAGRGGRSTHMFKKRRELQSISSLILGLELFQSAEEHRDMLAWIVETNGRV
jgi:hypothetical protein